MKKITVQQIVIVAFLVALEIVFTRFLSINLPIVRIGFGFLPVAINAILYGPVWAGIGYAIGDICGMLIWPTGPYFPGFTVSTLCIGIIYGLFFYKKELTWKRTTIAVVCVVVGFTVIVNTIWISLLYGKAFWGLMPARLIEAAIMIPVQILLIKLVYEKVFKKTSLSSLLPEIK